MDDKTVIKPRTGQAPDFDRTVIKPRPAGKMSDSRETVITPRRRPISTKIVDLGANTTGNDKQPSKKDLQKANYSLPGMPPLIEDTSQLLSALSQLKQLDGNIKVNNLHVYLKKLLIDFKNKAQKHSSLDDIEKASYALCATIDEAVLNTSWGENSMWSQRPLLSIFHKETYGGEKFYAMLDEETQSTVRNYDLLELLYMCMSLGFLGKMRVESDGQMTADKVRSQTYQLLAKNRDRYKRDLSSNVSPIEAKRLRLYSFLPVWFLAALLTLAAFGIYKHWLFDLNQGSDKLVTELSSLIPLNIEASLPEGSIRKEVIYLRQLLHAEIEHGVLSVDDYTNYSTITLHANELFSSGSASIATGFYPVLDKISKALEVIPGQIIVVGHTDNTAIRTASFPSNWHLSLARASAVGKYMSEAADLKARVLPEGRGDTEPVSDNSSIEGRAQNRRVTINLFYKTPVLQLTD